MGKSKFRISDMMPNSWFYKLRDMSKPRRIQDNSKPFESTENLTSIPPKRTNISNRSSYYISSEEREDKLKKQSFKALDTHFPFEPLISPKLRLETKPSKPNYTKPISSVSPKGFDFRSLESCTVTESPKDIIFDLVLTSPEIKLRPIVTKPIVKKEEKRKNRGRKIKVRSISPRCNSQRKWILESLVVVKYTRNPEKDFTESMVEMIIENNIMKTEDLEELLACYLSLNSKEYHNIIIKAFEKIWFVFSTCHT